MARGAPPPPDLATILKTPAFRIGVGILLIVGIWLGVRKLEVINRRHHIERRLTEHPTLGPKLASWRETIVKNLAARPSPEKVAAEQLAVALWAGEVVEFSEGKALNNLPPTTLLTLKNPLLLEGEAGSIAHKDITRDKILRISFKNYPTGLYKPKKDETWLIAVWRDAGGNNVVHSAEKVD